ncbi:hypothetical protein BDN72DRAFT_892074 [Pluteus cervinus]|uniref:Uncharacterized protein n=1 Tax=Pluteus cervinus TaxID=181527 RepID=A0ACD3BD94_9AGAR|nr:hypothetical protein BDN72DRAFT_892074 [Pluteus cervinus]
MPLSLIPAQLLWWSTVALVIAGLMQLGSTWIEHNGLTTQNFETSPPLAGRPTPILQEDIVKSYSWLEDDFPNSLPVELDTVAMKIENSHHYNVDSPDSTAEYLSLYPGDLGFLRLGPNKRFFGISLYHQLHCLDSLRLAIAGTPHTHARRPSPRPFEERDLEQGLDSNEKSSRDPAQEESSDHDPAWHVNHCLNYLRQTILCNADLTLEPEIKLGSQDVGEGLGVTHVCKDWSGLYDFAEQNTKEWQEWRKGHGASKGAHNSTTS